MAALQAAVPGRAAPAAWLWATVLLTVGAFGAAIVLAPAVSAAPGRGLAWLLFLGSSVHVGATAWFYTVPDVRAHAWRHRTRYVWVPLALVAGAALAAVLAPAAWLGWLLLPYFAWQFFHFQKQNLGVVALAARSHGAPAPGPAERRALMAAGWAGIAGLLLRPGLLQLGVDPGLGALFPAAGAALAGAVAAGVIALVRRPPGERPPGVWAATLVSLLFPLPIFVFRSPYAAVGGMTIAHGLQYLLLVGLTATGGRPGGRRLLRLAILLDVALMAGAALGVASHLHAGPAWGRALYGAYLGAVMAHFVVDAGLWRLRDPFPRRFLSARLPYLVGGPPRRRPSSVADAPVAEL
jgi:hypothetical protein